MDQSITVSVTTLGGADHLLEIPVDITVKDLIRELVVILKLPTIDAEDHRIPWRLDDRDLAKTLDDERTLENQGVSDGHRLLLIRATVAGGSVELAIPGTFQAAAAGEMLSGGPNLFVSFLWWCAGAIPSVLRDVPTAWNKYAAIGMSVLATALLGAISAGYAMHSAAGSVWLASSFAVVWGSLIFSIDRFLVSALTPVERSARRMPTIAERLLLAVPRLVLVALMAFSIAKPLELALFRDSIQQKILENQTAPLIEQRKELALKQAELFGLRERFEFETAQLTRLNEALIAELSGNQRRRITGIPGAGPAYHLLQQEREQAWANRANLEKQLAEKESEIATLKNQEDALMRTGQLSQTSFLSRLEAFSVLVSEDRRVALANYMILLFILILESSPIVLQILSTGDAYSAKVEALAMASGSERTLHTNQVDADMQSALNSALDRSFLNPSKED